MGLLYSFRASSQWWSSASVWGQAGFIDTWARGILYAGRSLAGLIIVVVIAAIIGAIVWAIAALLYNWIAGVGGGIKLTFK